ncbi:MAG TPA: DMT family transporter [Thermoanaerobaculia bacterium]|jgi:drug/metabolite transporter (DMT)-like permease
MSVPISALALVVACSLGWAGFDLLRKLLVQEVPPFALLFLQTIGTAPLFAAWMLAGGAAPPRPGYWIPALGSIGLNIAANLLYLEGIRIAPISVTVPLLSLTPAFATLLAVPLLGEQPSAADVLGILMVIAGAIWLHWQPREASRAGDSAARGRRATLKGALMVALTSLFWSMTVPLDKLAVERAAAPLHGAILTGGVATAILLVLLAQRRLGDVARVRRVPGIFVLSLAVGALALGFQLLALPRVYVGAVETTKRGVGNFMALLSGRVFFGETVTVPKVLAVALMAAGVGLLLA